MSSWNGTRRRRVLGVSALSLVAALAAYALWVNFSYLLVPFGPAESDIRIAVWRHQGYYKIRPGTYDYEKYGTRFTINERGFRGPAFHPEKGRAFRIIALGESSTIGIESDEASTWPRQLERYLAQRGVSAEVINAGINGTRSRHHRALLEHEIVSYHPDLLVYYAGLNDHFVLNVERYPGREHWRKGRSDFFRHWRRFKVIQARLVLLKAAGVDMAELIPSSNAWTRKYRANLEAMIEIANRAGIGFMMVTQVLNYPLEVFDAILEGAAMPGVARRLSLFEAHWDNFFRQIDVLTVQKSVASRHPDVKLVDLHQVFRDSKAAGRRLFHDPVHLTEEGNRLIAESLAGPIEREYSALARKRNSP